MAVIFTKLRPVHVRHEATQVTKYDFRVGWADNLITHFSKYSTLLVKFRLSCFASENIFRAGEE